MPLRQSTSQDLPRLRRDFAGRGTCIDSPEGGPEAGGRITHILKFHLRALVSFPGLVQCSGAAIRLTWGTGTGATAGAQVTVTFASSYSGVVVVMIVARNAATANLGLYISAALGSFTINSANVPASSQANTVFSAKWLAVG